MIAATSNASVVASQFAARAATIGPKVAGIERHYRQLLLTAIQARITKRTGGLAASYHVDETGVSSDHPAAHRHEVGFHGRDSLGRLYNDPPHAQVGPAADGVEGRFGEALEVEIGNL